jgi:urease accessory protein
MLRAASVVRSGEVDDARVVDRVTLDADDRNRRRVVLTGEGGTTFLLDLPQAAALRDGDGLVLDDGAIVRVIGVAEPLAEMTAATPLDFVRLAWHLGNRHTDVAIAPGALRVRRDHVLEAMAAGLGASVTPVEATFDPESNTPHRHDEGDDHDHDHDHHAAAVERSPAATLNDEREANFPPAALYRLQAWLSPGYPVGAFSFSSGLEWAIEVSDIIDAPSLQRWITVILADGGGFCDAVFFVHAHRAIEQNDDKALAAVAELALAFAPSKAPSRDDRPRQRVPCRDPRRVAVRGARPSRHRAMRLSGRSRRGGRRPRHHARAGARRLSARARRQSHFRRGAAHPARPDRRPARARRARAGRRGRRGARAHNTAR